MLQGESGGMLEVHSRQTSYVWQEPGSQIVTDTVEYEMVFGLENQGMPPELMQRRLAEMVTFFGLEDMLGRDTMHLSGGEMQILNVAAALAVNPDLLLLDEPTSQLDPVGARNLIDLLRRINEELGTTIVIAEQRLEDLIPLADEMILMAGGKFLAQAAPQDVFWQLGQAGNNFFPSYMRLFGQWENRGCVPETPRDARRWFEENFESREKDRTVPGVPPTGMICRNVSFRYRKSSPDVLHECSVEIPWNRITCIAGGNGSGKTTLLGILSGRYTPYRGKLKRGLHSPAVLPQETEYLFLRETVEEELDGKDSLALKFAERFGLADRMGQHPMDLSGGERQRLGLAMVLGREADGYLLDEPTKGLDEKAKGVLGEILRERREEGRTILFVSHDMEFAAEYSDYMALMFRGRISLLTDNYSFFTDNHFYTTSISRMARGVSRNIITREDVAVYAKKKDS